MPETTVKDVKKEIYLMLHKTQEMLDLTEEAFTKNKSALLDQTGDIAKEISNKEDSLTETLSKMAPSNGEARAILTVPGHVEKIATFIGRIKDNTATKIREGLLFSDKAIKEAVTLFDKAKNVIKKAGETVVTGSAAGVDAITTDCNDIIRLADEFAAAHEERLVTGECSPKSSSTYLCVLYAFEDIASHVKDIVRKMTAR